MMKLGIALFILGVFMLMAGINISPHWPEIGVLMSIAGGFVMGSGTPFLTSKKSKKG